MKPKSKIRFPERVLAALLLVTGSASGLAACAAGSGVRAATPSSPPRVQPEASPALAAGAVVPTSLDPVASDPPEQTAVATGPGGELAELAAFFRALAELERGARQEHVRIAWLGDSHSAADFLPNAVRSALVARFGTGGPGFMHAGVRHNRHSNARVEQLGRWRTEPLAPSSSQAQGDGIYGLGGMRVRCESPDCRLSIELLSGAVRDRALWQVLYRLPQRARLRVRVGAEGPRQLEGAGGPTRVQRARFSGAPADKLKIEVVAGRPEVFGVIVEGSEPGVVLDTLGINGARLATPLAWDEAAWTEELEARRPELVVMAYGTNEAFERRPVARYREHLTALVGRWRRVAPLASCLVLGPPDGAFQQRARIGEIDALLRIVAAELGCAHFSLSAAMGGPGSFERWARVWPPLAAPDRVHLTPKGYVELGRMLATRLLAAQAGAQNSALTRAPPPRVSVGPRRTR
ncbi:MAG TPA: GDSL-type esterase/lipase family protein [Polyangiaceae bacterium]